ncbi:MAG TPA: hypothetical protein VGP47_03975 [Parachlamydiaceae bacterium]|nr:hypothetical protein [Parachlamydiaceae bacterium]
MIRNQEPEFECSYCDKKAVAISPIEDDFLCESCVADYEDPEESFLLPTVNSPRTGVCGYVG